MKIGDFLEFFGLDYKMGYEDNNLAYVVFDPEDDSFDEIMCLTKKDIVLSIQTDGRDDIHLYEMLEEDFGMPSNVSPNGLLEWLKKNPQPYSNVANEPMSEEYYQYMIQIAEALVNPEENLY